MCLVLDSGPPVLPQELIDEIITSVSSSKRTLLKCTLVHRTWVPTSRSHLFRTLQVEEPRFSDFLSYARSAEFGPQYVRDLTLNGYLPQLRQGDTPNGNRHPVTPAYLRDLLEQLPRLESLFLFMVLLRDEADPAIYSLPSPFIQPLPKFSLRSLKMYYCGAGTDTIIHFALPLTLFSHISSLCFRSQKFATGHQPGVLTEKEEVMIHALAAAFPRVEDLRIDDNVFQTDAFMRIMALSLAKKKGGIDAELEVAANNITKRRIQGLQSLEIDSRHQWNAALLGGLLRQAGPQLKSLSVQMAALSEPEGMCLIQIDFVSLTSCQTQSSFVLRCTFGLSLTSRYSLSTYRPIRFILALYPSPLFIISLVLFHPLSYLLLLLLPYQLFVSSAFSSRSRHSLSISPTPGMAWMHYSRPSLICGA